MGLFHFNIQSGNINGVGNVGLIMKRSDYPNLKLLKGMFNSKIIFCNTQGFFCTGLDWHSFGNDHRRIIK